MTLRAKRTKARQHIFNITILEKEAESYEKSSDMYSTCMRAERADPNLQQG